MPRRVGDASLAEARAHAPTVLLPEKKNCRHASHHVSARETIIRSLTRSTPARWRSASGARVFLYSTWISHGLPGRKGSTAERSASARRAPSSIRARARSGAMLRADCDPRPCLTATVTSSGPRSSRASSQAASSPETISTGQPHVPQSAALIPVSPTRTPLNQRFCQTWPETVWFMTPRRVPAIACMPTNSAASTPLSRNSVYSVHSSWTTKSHASSSNSGISELNIHSSPAPWQSIATISVAPAAFAPRTAALISSV